MCSLAFEANRIDHVLVTCCMRQALKQATNQHSLIDSGCQGPVLALRRDHIAVDCAGMRYFFSGLAALTSLSLTCRGVETCAQP